MIGGQFSLKLWDSSYWRVLFFLVKDGFGRGGSAHRSSFRDWRINSSTSKRFSVSSGCLSAGWCWSLKVSCLSNGGVRYIWKSHEPISSYFAPINRRKAHVARPLPHGHHFHVERHVGASSDYLKALVFGGLDGIVTVFAIVAGCVGAHLTPMQTLIVGCGNLLADAISMGFGEVIL